MVSGRRSRKLPALELDTLKTPDKDGSHKRKIPSYHSSFGAEESMAKGRILLFPRNQFDRMNLRALSAVCLP